MAAWATFLEEKDGNVIPFRSMTSDQLFTRWQVT
jgi:hypothetical protein